MGKTQHKTLGIYLLTDKMMHTSISDLPISRENKEEHSQETSLTTAVDIYGYGFPASKLYTTPKSFRPP